ncbi:serine carboxypeptidase S28 [Nitzschia inconspicua]|uniref:Serine carboxypeptidase S28 n=1 Tax=Nitzschia inconspicua TaxID=303405 RepID=A0A9K3LWR8_9STRA|nr:serine carboxypeptidase S28 [Nitzschia inconspicua]
MWPVPVLIPGIMASFLGIFPSIPEKHVDNGVASLVSRRNHVRGSNREDCSRTSSFLQQLYPNMTEVLSYETRYYNNTVDHLNPFSEDPPRFSHRYLINDKFFGKISLDDNIDMQSDNCPGPILLYAGNEGDITEFWNANGFMQYLAVKYGGLLLFPEERYYGKSFPSTDMRYLTTQQVLEDYIELLDHVKTEYQATSCPTIAFGGSYGGTLAAFLRSAYPFSIQGALASSSELGYYDMNGWESRGISEYTFAEIVATQYNKTEGCLQAIWEAAELLDAMSDSADDRTMVIKAFNFCDESALQPFPSSLFVYGLEGLPQQNYPYPVGGLPAWPVQAVCEILTAETSDSLLQRAAKVTALSMRYSLDGTCLSIPPEGPGNVPGDGPGKGSWGYQSCTETLHSFSSVARDSSRPGLRNYDIVQESSNLKRICHDLYDVQPNINILQSRYGGFDVAKTTSNTIFSSGALDPWGGAALTVNDGGPDAKERGVHFFMIANGAHHLDLRGWSYADPADVKETRQKEEEILVGWMKDWFQSSIVATE